MAEQHFQALVNMYMAAPINQFYQPKLSVSQGASALEIAISEKYMHSAQAVHGSVYFKLLDDAAFFAANSLEFEFFMLTTSFTTYITRPVSQGKMRAVGKVVNQNKSQIIAEAVVLDDHDREIARGSGIFVRSKMLLTQALGYKNS